jgi:GNAT superfamily N-acetyltransferase
MLWRRDGYELSDDRARLDRAAVHRFLAGESYWAQGIPRPILDRAIDHSLCFGLYEGSVQCGFARVVTDHATFAYLCDVYVESAHRAGGLGVWLVECILGHPELQGLRRFCLMTRDAHALYGRFGFKAMPDPARFMERFAPAPDLYRLPETTP